MTAYNLDHMAESILSPPSSLDGLIERLPSDPHLRGEAFERAVYWFLKTDPSFAPELREVWLWNEWPGRWGADIGIDLVAETWEGLTRMDRTILTRIQREQGFEGTLEEYLESIKRGYLASRAVGAR